MKKSTIKKIEIVKKYNGIKILDFDRDSLVIFTIPELKELRDHGLVEDYMVSRAIMERDR